MIRARSAIALFGLPSVAGCLLTTDLGDLASGAPAAAPEGGTDSNAERTDAATADGGGGGGGRDASAEAEAGASALGCGGGRAAGLVAYWAMEEGAGGDVRDCSGNHFDGTIVGDVTWSAGRRAATKALTFHGGLVQLPQSPLADFTGSFSIAAWVSLAEGVNSGVMGRGDQINDRGWSIEMESDSSLSFYLAPTGSTQVQTNAPDVPTSTWIHIAMVFEAGVAQTIFLQGKAIAQTPGGPAAIAKPSRAIQLGRGWGSCCKVSGSIDEIRLFDRALTTTEVAALASE